MTCRFPFLSLPFLLIIILSGCDNPKLIEENRLLMNTIVSIKIPSLAHPHPREVIRKTFDRIEEIEKIMNMYSDKSECSAINRLDTRDTVKLSKEMTFVLKKSLELYNVTSGAFDITVSPLVRLWQKCKKQKRAPTDEELNSALSVVGSGNILIDKNGYLEFKKRGVKIDLSGIAKGFAVDEAVRILRKNGIKEALVNAGGDIYCLGDGPKDEGWVIGIKHPRRSGLIGVLRLTDKAVATSGDYEDFFIIGKRRYSHIIDPKKGYPINNRIMSVTVIAPDCITADGLATAVSVLGPREGIKLLESISDIDGVVISKDGNKLKVDITTNLKNIYEEF